MADETTPAEAPQAAKKPGAKTPKTKGKAHGKRYRALAQKIEDKPAAQGCHAYQQAADGSWVELPCQEVGPPSQTPTRGKSATRAPDEETR